MKRKLYNLLLNVLPRKVKLKFSFLLTRHARILLESSFYSSAEFERNGELWILKNPPFPLRFVVDGGANRGDWTSVLLKNNPNLNKVALIEPNAGLAMSLKNRFEHDERTIIVNLGLDYRKDYIPFDVPSEGDSHGNFSSSIFSSPSEISGIETTTVDDLVNELNFESLDLLKLDLEGFDHYALLGARNSFANNKIRMVQLEVTRCWEQSGSSPCSALRFLNNAGFKIFLLKRNSLEALNNISDMTHFSLYCNFIGIHKMYFEKEKETR